MIKIADEEITGFPRDVFFKKLNLTQRTYKLLAENPDKIFSEHTIITILKVGNSGANISRSLRDLSASGYVESFVCPTCQVHKVWKFKKNAIRKQRK